MGSDDEDLEFLRLAALNSRKPKSDSIQYLGCSKNGLKTVSNANSQNCVLPDIRRNFKKKVRRINNHVNWPRNGSVQRVTHSRVNSNLISVPIAADEETQIQPKLALPQDKYLKRNVQTDSKEVDDTPSKFKRYEHSDKSESESEEENANIRNESDTESLKRSEKGDNLDRLMDELDEMVGVSSNKESPKCVKAKVKNKKPKIKAVPIENLKAPVEKVVVKTEPQDPDSIQAQEIFENKTTTEELDVIIKTEPQSPPVIIEDENTTGVGLNAETAPQKLPVNSIEKTVVQFPSKLSKSPINERVVSPRFRDERSKSPINERVTSPRFRSERSKSPINDKMSPRFRSQRSISPINDRALSPRFRNDRSKSPICRQNRSRSRSRSPLDHDRLRLPFERDRLSPRRSPSDRMSPRRSPSDRRSPPDRRSPSTFLPYAPYERSHSPLHRTLSPLGIDTEALSTITRAPLSPRSAAFVLRNRQILARRKMSPRRSVSSRSSISSRSRSPSRGRSMTPLSPRRRSISPRPRVYSPLRRNVSPRRRSVSPLRRRSISPRNKNLSPVRRRSRSPLSPLRRRSVSPRRIGPARGRYSPKRMSPIRNRNSKSPPSSKLPVHSRLGSRTNTNKREQSPVNRKKTYFAGKSSGERPSRNNRSLSLSLSPSPSRERPKEPLNAVKRNNYEKETQSDENIKKTSTETKNVDPVLEARKRKFESKAPIEVATGIIKLKTNKSDTSTDKNDDNSQEIEVSQNNETELQSDNEFIDVNPTLDDLWSSEESDHENEGRFKLNQKSNERKVNVIPFTQSLAGLGKNKTSEGRERRREADRQMEKGDRSSRYARKSTDYSKRRQFNRTRRPESDTSRREVNSRRTDRYTESTVKDTVASNKINNVKNISTMTDTKTTEVHKTNDTQTESVSKECNVVVTDKTEIKVNSVVNDKVKSDKNPDKKTSESEPVDTRSKIKINIRNPNKYKEDQANVENSDNPAKDDKPSSKSVVRKVTEVEKQSVKSVKQSEEHEPEIIYEDEDDNGSVSKDDGGDLRAELSRRRAQRRAVTLPSMVGPPARILQTAFQEMKASKKRLAPPILASGIVRPTKGVNASERRVLVLKRAAMQTPDTSQVGSPNAPHTKVSKQETRREVRLPIHFRLGVAGNENTAVADDDVFGPLHAAVEAEVDDVPTSVTAPRKRTRLRGGNRKKRQQIQV